MELDYNPKIIDDLELYTQQKLFQKNDYYFIGSKRLDICCEVSFPIYSLVAKVRPYLNGKYSLDEIQDLLNDLNIKIKASELCDKLIEVGLIETQEKRELIRGEASLFMKNIINFDVDNDILSKNRIAFLILSRSVFLGIFITAILSLILRNKISLFANSIKISIVSYILVGIISALFHELMHLSVAVSNRIKVERISVAFYLSVIPIIYVKFKNVYFYTSMQRLKVSIAGVMGNLFLTLLAMFIDIFINNSIFIKAVFFVNSSLVLGNLVPFVYGDGYFAIAEILGQHNIRTSLIKILVYKNKKIKINKKILTYFIGAIFYMFIIGSTIVKFIISMFKNSNNLMQNIIALILIFSNLFFILKCIFKIINMRRKSEVKL